MGTRVTVFCDICQSDKSIMESVITYGRSMDPAGSMDDDSEMFHLCYACFMKCVRNSLLLDKGNRHRPNRANGAMLRGEIIRLQSLTSRSATS